MMAMQKPRVEKPVTVGEAAKSLGVEIKVVSKWIHQGKLRGTFWTPGGVRMIPKEAVRALKSLLKNAPQGEGEEPTDDDVRDLFHPDPFGTKSSSHARKDLPPRPLTLTQYAHLLGVTSGTARRWCMDGKVPGAVVIDDAGHWRIPLWAVPASLKPVPDPVETETLRQRMARSARAIAELKAMSKKENKADRERK
ncbi:helix-turn-helix domain-containing protein [Limnoglobus roseus]|uniref:Helix-turn-helix domain-containing protein n=1 Tax=Limnoglobus roseus TaxID=2598579 RepID=A0A5C1AH27_9BACT|nr:helix-turn-helix domain-containing protein [Limnoglobus roseus]QEL17553.1 hypothetical protein PX52LOC_04545 [Limnoglobus roseus]